MIVSQPATMEAPNPARGRKLFLQNCAHCHGIDGSGDEGPDLRGEDGSDRFIARRILQGVPHQMPSFAKKFHVADIQDLTAYLRTLQ